MPRDGRRTYIHIYHVTLGATYHVTAGGSVVMHLIAVPKAISNAVSKHASLKPEKQGRRKKGNIIIMEICKTPTPRLKALNRHNSYTQERSQQRR